MVQWEHLVNSPRNLLSTIFSNLDLMELVRTRSSTSWTTTPRSGRLAGTAPRAATPPTTRTAAPST